MNPAIARNEIEPLLNALIRQLADQGRATERAIYLRIRKNLRAASSPHELARPFHDLSTMATVRRRRTSPSGDANILLARILEKAEQLAAETAEAPTIH